MFNSGHLFRVGTVIVISAVHQDEEETKLEIYALSFNDESFFKCSAFRYPHNYPELLDGEIEQQVNNIIDAILREENARERDSGLFERAEPGETDKEILVTITANNFHRSKLSGVKERTACCSLRDYLTIILSFSEGIIRNEP